MSYVGLNPRVRQSGLGAAHHGRISKIGRSHARAMLVEAAWAAAKAPGPLHAFFVSIRARSGHQVAAVAVARKLAVLCWHLLTKDATIFGHVRPWSPTRSAAWRSRRAAAEEGQQAGQGSDDYYVKTLRDREKPSPKRQNATMRTLFADGNPDDRK